MPITPGKISGTCGRLLCCLNYEYPNYLEAAKGMSPVGSSVMTPEGVGCVCSLHFLNDKLSVKLEDGKIWEGTAYLSYAGYKGTLGYSKTGKKNGIGSLNKAGEQVDQFEEGDYVLVQNARTTYFQLSKTFFDISLTAMYGQTKFDEGSVKNLKQKEFDLWASYNFTKNLGAALGYTITEGEKSQALKDQNLKQLNATLTYKF
jgi:hypothetical protein